LATELKEEEKPPETTVRNPAQGIRPEGEENVMLIATQALYVALY
jgi:hypothetical protein